MGNLTNRVNFKRCSVVFFPHTLYVVWSDGKKGDDGCLSFTKSFRKVWLESNWNTTFWVVSVDNFRETGGSEKVVLLYRWECSKRKFVFHFLPSHLWYQFQTFAPFLFGKCTWLVKMANAIPWNLLVFNFAYHLPKPRADRFAHVNSKQPLFLFILP